MGDPPTSPDKHTVGDEIIWETLISFCSNDLIIVSRDRTYLENESLLRGEFNIDGKRCLLAVTDSLSNALNLVGKPSTPIEQAEMEEAAVRRAHETGRCPNCDVELDEEGYEGSDGDEAWWLTCPKCSFLAFPMRESGAKREGSKQ